MLGQAPRRRARDLDRIFQDPSKEMPGFEGCDHDDRSGSKKDDEGDKEWEGSIQPVLCGL